MVSNTHIFGSLDQPIVLKYFVFFVRPPFFAEHFSPKFEVMEEDFPASVTRFGWILYYTSIPRDPKHPFVLVKERETRTPLAVLPNDAAYLSPALRGRTGCCCCCSFPVTQKIVFSAEWRAKVESPRRMYVCSFHPRFRPSTKELLLRL